MSESRPWTPPSPALSPDHWAINTTTRCQQRCIYCFEGDREGLEDVPAERTRRLIDAAVGKVPMIIFMGAEPTLNSEILELTRYARGRGLQVFYSTNALRLANAEFLSDTLEAGLSGLEMSFHYPDEQVYTAITRASRKGFQRLLRALDNIERVNEESADRLAVNVNVVVSAFNVDRLAEVIAHVSARWLKTQHGFTFKRVLPSRSDVDAMSAQGHVSNGTIRRVMAGLDLGDGRFVFRDYPLCALPGKEHLSADLFCWLHGVEVGQNFRCQDTLEPMVHEMRDHPYPWLCEACTLDPVCTSRGIFNCGPPSVENRPVPVRGPMTVELAQLLGSTTSAGAYRVAADRPANRVLERLWHIAPPGERLPGVGARWQPLDDGVIRLEHGSGTHVVSVGTVPKDWRRPFLLRGVNIVQAHPSADLVAARELIAAFSELLPVEADAGEAPVHDPASAWLRFLGGLAPELVLCSPQWLGGRMVAVDAQMKLGAASQITLRVAECATGEARQVSLVAGTVVPSDAEAVRARLSLLEVSARGDPALMRRARERLSTRSSDRDHASARDVIAPFGDSIIIRLPTANAVTSCRLLAPGSTTVEGFVCAAGVLQPDDRLLRSATGSFWLAAIARALQSAVEDDRDAQHLPDFVSTLWRIFGSALLPRAGKRASLSGGVVASNRVSLRFETGSASKVNINFEPAHAERPAKVEHGGVAMWWQTPDQSPPTEDLHQVIERYQRLLVVNGG